MGLERPASPVKAVYNALKTTSSFGTKSAQHFCCLYSCWIFRPNTTHSFIYILKQAFVSASQALGPSIFIALIPVLTIALSLIGFHPVVTISLLGTSPRPTVLHMSPIWLSVALFGGGVLTFIVSPFNATLNVTDTVTGQKPSTVMKWNIKFCACFLVLIMTVVAAGQTLQLGAMTSHWATSSIGSGMKGVYHEHAFTAV